MGGRWPVAVDGGEQDLAVPLCRRRSSLQPKDAFYVVDEVSEPDFDSCPRDADGSDEEAHSVLLLGEDVSMRERTADLRHRREPGRPSYHPHRLAPRPAVTGKLEIHRRRIGFKHLADRSTEPFVNVEKANLPLHLESRPQCTCEVNQIKVALQWIG